MERIQWYPGHMAKAMRLMKDALVNCDGVIVVLDARCPRACLNPKHSELFKDKPILYVFNKADLVSRSELNAVSETFVEDGKAVAFCDAHAKKDVAGLYDKIFSLLKDKVAKNKEKGLHRPLRVMVAGIPNTGKSTIINALVGGKKAETGDKAGVTRSNQWVKMGELELLDTPGTMPPAFENQDDARHLAYCGSVNDDILDKADLALELIGELAKKYPEMLKERYRLTSVDKTPLELYEEICAHRGFLLRGGEYDYERGANAVLGDFRSGKIGKVMFE